MADSTRLFISYSRKDGNEAAARLHAALEDHGFGVWRDVRDIDPAQDFTADIERGIDSSDWIVVCITPDTLRDNCFVRREIGYALYEKKPVIVARFAEIGPPVSVFNHTWIDCFADWKSGLNQLLGIFKHQPDIYPIPETESRDPFRAYVEQLLARTVEYFKHAIIGPEPIELESEPSPEAIDRSATQPRRVNPLDQLFHAQLIDENEPDPAPEDMQAFTRFADAFEFYGGRVLLLGEPGAGKTVTLMAHTRNAAAARLDDPDAPLPLYHNVAFWDAENQTPLDEWFAESYGDLLPLDAVQREISAGRVLFLLDGLDELGGKRENPDTKERYDPRKRFMVSVGAIHESPLPNRAIITCRVKDYKDIGQKIALSGAVTLHPLTDDQMREYLREMPDLWAALEADDELREVARTPLLLSLFADGYKENAADAAQLRDLRTSPGDLRDKIFETYGHKRYEREKRRVEQIGESLPFTLEEIYEVLGRVATESVWQKYEDTEGFLWYASFLEATNAEHEDRFIELAIKLHLITPNDYDFEVNPSYRFVHLLLLDYFAFTYAFPRLQDKERGWLRSRCAEALGLIGDERAVELLISTLRDNYADVRRHAAEALGWLGDERAVYPLFLTLRDEDVNVRQSVAIALAELGDLRAVESLIDILGDDWSWHLYRAIDLLGELGDPRAVESLIIALNDERFWVSQRVAYALEQIGTPEALAAVAQWRAEQKTEGR